MFQYKEERGFAAAAPLPVQRAVQRPVQQRPQAAKKPSQKRTSGVAARGAGRARGGRGRGRGGRGGRGKREPKAEVSAADLDAEMDLYQNQRSNKGEEAASA